MAQVLKFLFFQMLVRPLVLVVLGLNVRHRQRLPRCGPAILAANHNSHLDTMVLMTLFPWSMLRRLRPVAAADYFLRNRLTAWFSQRIIGILPIDRSGGTPREELFASVHAALRDGDVVIVFPEGSRGEPETLQEFKSGLYHLCAAHPEVPLYPIFMHGLGKALPKGEALLVPFFCDVFVGEAM
ncbi:MAG: lysophospholipid acyltransferase family protein, partial [Thermoanaerobaculia bacterium]